VVLRVLVLVGINLVVLAALWALLELGASRWFPRSLEAVFDNPQAFRSGRPYVQDDAERGFVLRAGYSTPRMTVTRAGFRANAVDRQEDVGTPTIVCLGGSTTFGWGLADHESYPAQLQEFLDARYPGQVRVLNAGVPSYTSEQVCLTLEHVLALHPRMVIVQTMWNDLLFSFVENWYPDLLVHQRPSTCRRWLLKHSAVFRALCLHRADGTGDCRMSPQALEHYRSSLRRIVARCRKEDVVVVFSLPPLQEALVPEDGMRIGAQRVPREVFLQAAEAFVQVLENEAQELQVPLVRHRVAREAQPAVDLFLDAAHPVAQGYRLLAEDVGTTIERLVVLPEQRADERH